MKGNFEPVITSLYLIEREKWLQQIRRGENVTVIFCPKTDRFRRLHQLLEDKEYLHKYLGTKDRYLFQFVDFDISFVEDKSDVQEHIATRFNESNFSTRQRTFQQWMELFLKKNIHVVLIIADAEKYLTQENKHVLPLFFELSLDYAPTMMLMNFMEGDVTHPDFNSILTFNKELYENLFWYPLYPENDTRVFIRYLKNKWQMTLSKDQEDKIIRSCGGHFWLVKEAVRELLNDGNFSLENNGLLFRIDTIYQTLKPSEQRVLEKIATFNNQYSVEESHSYEYLRRMNILSHHNNLTIGFIEQYINARLHKEQNIELREGHVFINNISVDTFFTRKEYRIFKTLLQHKNEIVSRDNIAKTLWPDDNSQQYSDWAIDRVMARLRKKLLELSLSSKIIQVVRGKGYRFIS